MDFRDTLSSLLPPPRNDEPASLRQDILDELGDHLACAFNRELLRGADSSVARQRTLERFGDPAAVARRLWFDAMKGKIMTQRVLIATCLVVTLASLTLAGVIWRQSGLVQQESARAAAAAIRAMEVQNEKSQANQQEMLKHMRAMSEVARTTRSSDWNPVTFRLTEKSPGGPPAVGFIVELTPAEEPQAKPMFRSSDASGTVEFGSMKPGDYQFLIKSNWDHGIQRTSGSLNVARGTQVVKQVVCPRIPPEHVPVQFQCSWPADLANQGLLLFASFLSDEPTIAGGWQWDLFSFRSLLCGVGPKTDLIEIRGNRSSWNDLPGTRARVEMLTADLQKVGTQGDSVEWDAGNHRLMMLAILRRAPTSPDRADKSQFDILAKAQAPSLSPSSRSWSLLPETFWREKSATLVARPGRLDPWTIPLPEALIKAVREKLKADESSKTL
jgi:hypothetical protein